MLKKVNHKYVLSFGLVILAVLIQACAVNLPAVRDFSKSTVVASNSFNDIADDIPKSCVRRVNIDYEITPDQKLDNNKNALSSQFTGDLSTCNTLRDSLGGMLEVNKVLQGYAESLGKLASDDVVTFTQELDALEKSVGKININGSNPFTGARATAISALAKYLFNAAVNGYRQKELKETIKIGHEPLIQITDGLIDVANDYKALLRNEKQIIVRNQQILKLQFSQNDLNKRTPQLTDSQINELLAGSLLNMEFIDSKNKAADEYIELLGKMQEAHKLLFLSSDSLNSELLIAEIRRYAGELIPLINNIRKAYNN